MLRNLSRKEKLIITTYTLFKLFLAYNFYIFSYKPGKEVSQHTEQLNRQWQAEKRHYINWDNYQKLMLGMAYWEVCYALGKLGYSNQGELVREDSEMDVSVYHWDGTDGANIMVTFKDGKLVEEDQRGLD